MESKNKKLHNADFEYSLPVSFTSQAGLRVETHSDEWVLSVSGKGKSIDVSWLNGFCSKSKLKHSLLDALIHYAESRNSATVSTVCFAVRDGFPNDNSEEAEFLNIWNTLGSPAKKTLKGFLSTCLRLGHKNLSPHNEIAKRFVFKSNFSALHPTKGRLSDYEYDSVLINLRLLSESVPRVPPDNLDFYRSWNTGDKAFINFKNIIAYRFLVQIARRPKQISMLKWSDVLPVGLSFKEDINEPIYTGIRSLHVRIFRIKHSGQDSNFRLNAEKWSIPLSESFTEVLLRYRNLYAHGLRLAMNDSGVPTTEETVQSLLFYCPIIPDISIFSADFRDSEIINLVKNNNSVIFHSSEGTICNASKVYGVGLSERHGSVTATNNRLRHTWLCNAALSGRSLLDISKITNVTLPAARSYLQLGIKERQFIDENYAANKLLREAFNPKPFAKDHDVLIENEFGHPMGIENNSSKCAGCEHQWRMARPIACYGCQYFRPLLDADHESILNQATAKLEFIRKLGPGSVKSGSTRRLEKAISCIELTISICNKMRSERKGLELD